jgi:hypothetical protein
MSRESLGAVGHAPNFGAFAAQVKESIWLSGCKLRGVKWPNKVEQNLRAFRITEPAVESIEALEMRKGQVNRLDGRDVGGQVR